MLAPVIRPTAPKSVVVCGVKPSLTDIPFLGINSNSRVVVSQTKTDVLEVFGVFLKVSEITLIHRDSTYGCFSKSGPFYAAWKSAGIVTAAAPFTREQRLKFAAEPILAIVPAISDALHDLVYNDASILTNPDLRCSVAFQNTLPVMMASILGCEVYHETPLEKMGGIAQEFASILGVTMIETPFN